MYPSSSSNVAEPRYAHVRRAMRGARSAALLLGVFVPVARVERLVDAAGGLG
jgi:hypothetical protein